MKLYLENIGKIKKAYVEINGITVIAGKNHTGKSTVGKALFSIFNSFYNVSRRIESEKYNGIDNILYREFDYWGRSDEESLTKKIMNLSNEEKKDVKTIFNIINNEGSIALPPEDDCAKSIERIIEYLNVDDEIIFKHLVEEMFDAEFNEQINNIYDDSIGKVALTIKDNNVYIEFVNNNISKISDMLTLKTEAIYIDDPFIVDEIQAGLRRNRTRNHREHLRHILTYGVGRDKNLIKEILVNNKFNNIYNKVSKICYGSFVRGKNRSLEYRLPGQEATLNLKNLSTGMKTFVILKRLLETTALEENGTIILDEPEIHLHPEWQLLFAELIVLLQKEFDMHIILNTHSPYFLNALEVYSQKYKIDDRCKYYTTVEKNGFIEIEDVTNETEVIYDTLATPLQVLEEERFSND